VVPAGQAGHPAAAIFQLGRRRGEIPGPSNEQLRDSLRLRTITVGFLLAVRALGWWGGAVSGDHEALGQAGGELGPRKKPAAH